MTKEYKAGEYETKPLGQGDDENADSSKQDQEQEEEQEEAGMNEEESEETDVEPKDTEESSDGEEFDFEAELERERERLGKKIDRLGKKVDKERGRRVAAERVKGLSEEDVSRIVDERVAQTEKRVLRSRAEEVAERLAGGNDALKNLILLKYDRSIVPSGSLEDDLENAFALATRKASSAKISELRAAAKSKKNRAGSSGAGISLQQKKPLKYTEEDVDGAKFAGVSIEEFMKHKKEIE